MPEHTSASVLIRAVQYVRMSTEHQQYSTENQAKIIQDYAAKHGMEIVREYADSGKSGLRLAGRDSLQTLLQDVETGTTDFEAILVYDVSRWGRFQDTDESAYYEYLCKRAHIHVHYCAEQFENDGSLPSTVMKSMKRAMAGEYSRELSAKVFLGQCHLIELGFHQGGIAGYGLRRQLLDQAGTPKQMLSRGEQKSIQTDRVVLVPGTEEEVKVVREIYEMFVNDGKSEAEIVDSLNDRAILMDTGRPWTRYFVRSILSSPKYAGANVYNRVSYKLKKRRVVNPAEMWIRRDNAFQKIVELETFERAQQIIRASSHRYGNEEMIELLKQLFAERGMLSAVLIDEIDAMPSSAVYSQRFGGLLRAYQMVGYTPTRDYEYLDINRYLRRLHDQLSQGISTDLKAVASCVERDPLTDLLTVNQELTISFIISRCQPTPLGSYRWKLRLDRSLNPDVTIAARLLPGNKEVLDYYLFPSMDALEERIRLKQANALCMDVYRFKDLAPLLDLVRRTHIKEAA
jgi:DNA invertase Pin-like site-specific DNA recombinase